MSAPLKFVLGFAALLMVLLNIGCGADPQTYVNRGNKFYDAGKYDDAAIQYQKAIQKAPSLGEAHYRLGLLYLTQNQPAMAYREISRAADLMPGNEVVLAKMGQLALALYNLDPARPKQLYDQATKAADQLYRKNANGFDGNLLKGALALIDRKPADSVAYLRKAIQTKPGERDAQLGLARALVQNDQAQEGLNLGLELIKKDKTFGPPYDFLFEQYQLAGKASEAENILKLKVENNPKQAPFILELARFYATKQDPTLVNAAIQKLVVNKADFPDGNMIAGDFYVSVGRPKEALERYQAGLADHPKDPLLYQRRLARLLSAQRKWPDALAQIDAILKKQPEDQEAKLNRALVWLSEGKPENLDPAITELRAQVQKRPKDPALHFELGNGLARKGDPEGAKREWLSAAQQDRKYLPARLALVETDLAQGKSDDALKVAQQMVDVAPKDARVRLWFATALTSAGRYQEAHSELDRLVSQFPTSAQVRFRQGTLALSEHKYKEAEDIFHRLETSGAADPQVMAGLAESYKGENQPAKAIQFLEGEVKRNPDSPITRQVLAQFAATSGNYDLAIEQYKQLAATTPNSEQIQLSLASLYNIKGSPKEALPILEKVVQTDPKSAPATLQLARTLVADGNVNGAKARYRRVLELEPTNPIALNDLAFLMAEAGENLDEALSFANKGLHLASDPGIKKSLSDTLGWIYLKKNMYDSAIQTFQTLLKNDPDNSTYRYHLGATLYQKGDKKQARVQLEAALAGKPPSSDAPKIRELLARL